MQESQLKANDDKEGEVTDDNGNKEIRGYTRP